MTEEMVESAPTTAQRIHFDEDITQVKTTTTYTQFNKNLPLSTSSSEKPTEHDLEERAANFADADANRKKKQVSSLANTSLNWHRYLFAYIPTISRIIQH